MEITISDGSIVAMGVVMGICFGVPVLFILANRNRLRLMPLVMGLASWCLFSYFGSGMLAGSLFDASGASGAAATAILQAIIIIVGHALVIKFLSLRSEDSGVSLSYGLGYALIYMLLVGGMEQFSKISLVTAINNNGFDKVATTVEDTDVESLRALVQQIADTPVYEHLMGGAEMIFFFLITVSVAVMVWYAVTKSRRELMLIAYVAELVCLGSVLLYSAGAIGSLIAVECIYGVCAVAAAIFAFRLFRKYEGAPVFHADPVDRNRL